MATKDKLANRDRLARNRSRENARAAAFATLPPDERLKYIAVNVAPTEFEVQAYLYEQLRSLRHNVRGEIKTKCGTCRFDLVVVEDGRPVRLIEVKKGQPPINLKKVVRAVKHSRRKQIARYEQFGLPVDSVCGLAEAKQYVEQVRLHRGWPETPSKAPPKTT
jgi:hypothetical protein